MSDPDAIARCWGFAAWPTSRISAWPASELERLRDPKDELNRAIAELSGGRRSQRDSGAVAIFDRLGVEIDLDQLSRLEPFRRFSTDLAASLPTSVISALERLPRVRSSCRCHHGCRDRR